MNRIEWAVNGKEELPRRRAAFRERTELYRKLGYDRMAATEFAIETGRPVSGPALDIGTGKGLSAIALARRGFTVFSVDRDDSERALAALLAVEAGLENRIHFIHGDASALSFPDESFGCVAMMDVLHHVTEPRPVLEEAARVLRPSGELILADFSPEGFALVAQVHRDEGREHAVSGATLESAWAYLDGRGFNLTARRSGYQHDVIVLTKKRTKEP